MSVSWLLERLTDAEFTPRVKTSAKRTATVKGFMFVDKSRGGRVSFLFGTLFSLEVEYQMSMRVQTVTFIIRGSLLPLLR